MTSVGQCRAYLRARGLFVYRGRRCTLIAGHAGQHETARYGIGEPFTFRWGRDTTSTNAAARSAESAGGRN